MISCGRDAEDVSPHLERGDGVKTWEVSACMHACMLGEASVYRTVLRRGASARGIRRAGEEAAPIRYSSTTSIVCGCVDTLCSLCMFD